jgi:hypothetical protein
VKASGAALRIKKTLLCIEGCFFCCFLLADPRTYSTSVNYMKQAEESGLYAKW